MPTLNHQKSARPKSTKKNTTGHRQIRPKHKASKILQLYGFPEEVARSFNHTPGPQANGNFRTILMKLDVIVLLNLGRLNDWFLDWTSAWFLSRKAGISEKKAKSALDNLSETVYVDKRGQYSHEYTLTNIGTRLNADILALKKCDLYYEPLIADYNRLTDTLRVEDSTWLAIAILHNLKRSGHSRKELAISAEQQDTMAIAEVIDKLKIEKNVSQSDMRDRGNLIFFLSDQGSEFITNLRKKRESLDQYEAIN